MNHFPLRTLMVCVTFWTIATELMLFDYLKYNARVDLLEQAARALHPAGPVYPGAPPVINHL